MPPSEISSRARLADLARSRVSDDRAFIDYRTERNMTRLDTPPESFFGASVLIQPREQLAAAAAMIELDGVARRIVLVPPGVTGTDLAAVAEDAEVDSVVVDSRDVSTPRARVATLDLSSFRSAPAIERVHDTEWILLTSGTSGRPKLVQHSLAGLTGAVPAPSAAGAVEVWSTFYDIRRYGGLQIFLRALIGGRDLALSSPRESLEHQLSRLGRAGVTSISGTPSHWRKVLMCAARADFKPDYVRLSGETADQAALDALSARFPDAAVEHAYASTEAGVAFAVADRREGFPETFLNKADSAVEMKIVDGTLRIRSPRAASRYVGPGAPVLKDDEGFVDTGDFVERRGGRVHFLGRKGGIINVGGQKVAPEEVEAVINTNELVANSRVVARRNPITGAVVAAEIVLRRAADATEDSKRRIMAVCRERLDPYKVPVTLRFVDEIPLTAAGKIGRSANG